MAGAVYQIDVARQSGEQAALMAEEVRAGLTAPLPTLPSKYFYDDRGSRLFEAITGLPEYYQTRTELSLLEAIGDQVIARTRPTELVELGSGTGRKIRLLLDAMARAGLLRRCILLDINARCLRQSLERLAADYPALEVRGIVGDLVTDLEAIGPGGPGGPGGGRLAVFFAGTIGNLHPAVVPAFLARMSRQLEPGDGFLVGLDLVKDVAVLEAAYNDAAGVTAEFNRNILRVLNARLGADFDLSAFEHVAFYDRDQAWIEMRLRAARDVRARIPAAGLRLRFRKGDEIRTEISCKYTRASFDARLSGTGLALESWYTDPEQLFALALLRRDSSRPALP